MSYRLEHVVDFVKRYGKQKEAGMQRQASSQNHKSHKFHVKDSGTDPRLENNEQIGGRSFK